MAQPLKTAHDTSVVHPVLFCDNPETHWLYHYWQNRLVLPIVNRSTLAELKNHFIQRSRTAHFGEQQRFADRKMVPYLRFSTELPHQAVTEVPRCQDSTDQKFLDLAYYSDSQYLVTEDKALLDLAKDVNFTILTAEHFREVLFNLFPNQ